MLNDRWYWPSTIQVEVKIFMCCFFLLALFSFWSRQGSESQSSHLCIFPVPQEPSKIESFHEERLLDNPMKYIENIIQFNVLARFMN